MGNGDTKQTAMIFVIAGISVLLFALWFTEDGVSNKNSWSPAPNKSPFDSEFRSKVNVNLARSFMKQQTEKMKMELENMQTAPPIRGGEVIGEVNLSSHKLVFEREEYYERLEQMEQAQRAKEVSHSIANELQVAINEKRIRKEQEEFFRAQYAQAFIENAKKAGYDVALDDQYRIIRYKKVMKKESPSLFQEPTGGR